jgi:3-deoxy-D-manno-octulosonic-acid transferase
MTAPRENTPLTLLAYRTATSALTPVVPFFLARRASRGKEESARMSERLGHASRPRPEGHLVWIHGASVGESIAVLPLIDALLNAPGRSVLVTSGTVTSAQLMAQRLPRGALHQYAPVDLPSAAARFLDHWKPDAALFVDSEIWPNLICAARDRGVPMALVNGRMSARSFAGWGRVRHAAKSILSAYEICLAQDEQAAERFRLLGARNVQVAGSLKADAPPMPADTEKLEEMSRVVAGRPVFLAASTHQGEDETILPSHDALRRRFPDLLTVLVPRHPERGAEIAMLCGARKTLRRSEGHIPERETAIYIADTLGELGLFYRLTPFAFVGGSLVPHGGQNPLEPARLARAVLAGPHTENFALAYQAIFAEQGSGRINSSAEIVALAGRLLEDPAAAGRMGEAAERGAATLRGALEKTRLAVEAMLAHARA